MNPADERILQSLVETRTIAMVGASVKPHRASHGVGLYMKAAGYRVIPVNPMYAGQSLFGETVCGSLADIDAEVHMLNLFRRSEDVLEPVTEALEHLSGLKSVWMQLDIANAEARALAEDKGLIVTENRCLKIEHARLLA